ncbi:PLC-like phosphodiesterase [Mycena floridula]|nr:PLC-like phosphodiesterase [Mycena floridula]
MVSKGISFYTYISKSIPKASVEFFVPGQESTVTSANNFARSKVITEQYNNINSFTGNLKGGTMTDIMSTPMVITTDHIVSFGFYDAGVALEDITGRHQSWVCVTKNQSKWMEDLAPVASDAAKKAFSKFLLPGAHDSGMNTMDTIKALTAAAIPSNLKKDLGSLIAALPEADATLEKLNNILLAFGITQKESITNMLKLGVRYFDFRPAGLHSLWKSSDEGIYHTHGFLPGMSITKFLNEIVSFLTDNTNEIIVVRISRDGISSGCKIPEMATLDDLYKAAIKDSGIVIGDASSLEKSIETLRTNKERLIILNGGSKADSYNEAAYTTLTAEPIITCFELMSNISQTITVLQCQGTPTLIGLVQAYAVAYANSATSPLMETKARFDLRTLPWVLNHAVKKFSADHNLIIMNDFIDGATCDVAIQLSEERLKDT